MKSLASRAFWSSFEGLPSDIQEHAREAYRRFQQDPGHPGLQFKRVHKTKPIYSARVTRDYRVLGVLRGDTIVWFWIGKHSDYERLLARR